MKSGDSSKKQNIFGSDILVHYKTFFRVWQAYICEKNLCDMPNSGHFKENTYNYVNVQLTEV